MDIFEKQFQDHGEKLKEWTALDFSNFYVRYYPHLLSHAKKFLTNHSQAEEVVQDAFLYLMTSLPEVDSELGVLRILKWKTRLLSLDVIGSNSKASFTSLDHVDLAVESELSESLQRADDAAIVALALAKLDERQREVLIASVYEERPTSELAGRLNLSENATRQLLLRAKGSFRKALLGEASFEGKSISEILSIAARKAAAQSGKYVSAAGIFIVFAAISIGIIPNLGSIFPGSQASPSVMPSEERAVETPGFDSSIGEGERSQGVASETNAAPESLSELILESPNNSVEQDEAEVTTALVVEEESSPTPPNSNEPETRIERPSISLASLSPYQSIATTDAEFEYAGTDFLSSSPDVIKIHSGVGLWAYVDYDRANMQINAVAFEVMIDGEKYYAAPRSYGVAKQSNPRGSTITYTATEIFLIDQSRNVLADTDFATKFTTVTIETDLAGEPTAATLHLN